MIHVIDKGNRHKYQDELEQHYRIRHQIYVKERRWMALDRPDQREIDKFDTDSTIYLLAIENDVVVGGTRLCRTTEPHLMRDVFPFLPNVRGLQIGPHIVEWTRIFVINEKRGTPVLNLVLAGMLEYCLRECFSQITVVMETWWLPRFLALGWDFEPLGIPIIYDNMEIVACCINVSEDAYLNTLASTPMAGPVLVSDKASAPIPQSDPSRDERPGLSLSSATSSLSKSRTNPSINLRRSEFLMRTKSPMS
jgi:acyl-homoserine lactone synthase